MASLSHRIHLTDAGTDATARHTKPILNYKIALRDSGFNLNLRLYTLVIFEETQ